MNLLKSHFSGHYATKMSSQLSHLVQQSYITHLTKDFVRFHILVSVDGFAVNDSVELGTRSREAMILRNIYMIKYEFITIIQY